jgi:hypothetical protein
MSKDDQLLDEAQRFCDPSTGEVLQRIPEELMQKLRMAQLARGVPGKASRHTGSYATWFVFLNSDIRDHVMSERRLAQRARNRQRSRRTAVAKTPSQSTRKSEPHGNQGLKQFVQRRQSDK